jgi:preprotein translocase subunit SecD
VEEGIEDVADDTTAVGEFAGEGEFDTKKKKKKTKIPASVVLAGVRAGEGARTVVIGSTLLQNGEPTAKNPIRPATVTQTITANGVKVGTIEVPNPSSQDWEDDQASISLAAAAEACRAQHILSKPQSQEVKIEKRGELKRAMRVLIMLEKEHGAVSAEVGAASHLVSHPSVLLANTGHCQYW